MKWSFNATSYGAIILSQFAARTFLSSHLFISPFFFLSSFNWVSAIFFSYVGSKSGCLKMRKDAEKNPHLFGLTFWNELSTRLTKERERAKEKQQVNDGQGSFHRNQAVIIRIWMYRICIPRWSSEFVPILFVSLIQGLINSYREIMYADRRGKMPARHRFSRANPFISISRSVHTLQSIPHFIIFMILPNCLLYFRRFGQNLTFHIL